MIDISDPYKTQEMCDKVSLENDEILKSVPNSCKNQKIYDKSVKNYFHALEFVPECNETRKCVIKLTIFLLLQYNLFLNSIKLKKCMIKLLILVPQQRNKQRNTFKWQPKDNGIGACQKMRKKRNKTTFD